MTLTLDLTHEEMRRLRGAEARGIDVKALLKGIIASLPELSEPVEDRTEPLFVQWKVTSSWLRRRSLWDCRPPISS